MMEASKGEEFTMKGVESSSDIWLGYVTRPASRFCKGEIKASAVAAVRFAKSIPRHTPTSCGLGMLQRRGLRAAQVYSDAAGPSISLLPLQEELKSGQQRKM